MFPFHTVYLSYVLAFIQMKSDWRVLGTRMLVPRIPIQYVKQPRIEHASISISYLHVFRHVLSSGYLISTSDLFLKDPGAHSLLESDSGQR